jgi:type VI secretion system secreted protein VgrG
VTFTGHSLGGGLASAASLATGCEGVTFNAAGISQNTATIYGYHLNTPNLNIWSYYIPGEALTNAQSNIKGWIDLKMPGNQMPLPRVPGNPLKLHGIDSVLRSMELYPRY